MDVFFSALPQSLLRKTGSFTASLFSPCKSQSSKSLISDQSSAPKIVPYGPRMLCVNSWCHARAARSHERSVWLGWWSHHLDAPLGYHGQQRQSLQTRIPSRTHWGCSSLMSDSFRGWTADSLTPTVTWWPILTNPPSFPCYNVAALPSTDAGYPLEMVPIIGKGHSLLLNWSVKQYN